MLESLNEILKLNFVLNKPSIYVKIFIFSMLMSLLSNITGRVMMRL